VNCPRRRAEAKHRRAEKKLGRPLTKAERKQFAFTPEQLQAAARAARVRVAARRRGAGQPEKWASR
jgi:hypothetical protein